VDYWQGLHSLKERLAPNIPDEYWVYEQRLLESLDCEQKYGSTETIRAERAEVVDVLNKLTLRQIGISFNELCSPAFSITRRDGNGRQILGAHTQKR
jgi:hypothetical protein